MDRQAPDPRQQEPLSRAAHQARSPSLRLALALIVSAVWVVVLLAAPNGTAITWLAVASALAIAVSLGARVSFLRWPPDVVSLGLGLVVGVATLALTHLLAPPVLAAVPAWAEDFRALYSYEVAGSGRPLALDVALTCLVILGEELIWRGLTLSALRARMPVSVAVALSALSYAVCQLGFGRTLPAVAALALGLVWGVLRVATWSRGRLLAPIVAHATWTLGVLFIWPIAR